MKHFFHTLIFSTAFIFCITGGVCAQSATTSQDSITAKVNWLKQKLNLTDTQSASIKSILLNVRVELDGMKQSSITSQQRSAQMRVMNQTFITQIKNVFTADQWIRYLGLESTNTDSLRQHAQQ